MNQERVVVRAAGRLDAGVHARAQIVSFKVTSKRSTMALFRGLNGLLPADVACLALSAAAPDFDPRRYNRGKTYRYRLLVRKARCPFRRSQCWHVGRLLDVPAMRLAAQCLVGQHDFTSFRASGCSARHPVRRVRAIEIQPFDDELHLVVNGEAFLRHQVRIMVGSLVEVGLGRREPDWLGSVLAATDRTVAARTAPAHGLSLERVHFHPPLEWEYGSAPKPSWPSPDGRSNGAYHPQSI